MKSFFEAIGLLVVGLLITMVVAVIYGLFVMFLWNYLAPAFQLPQLTFAQSYALSLLCSVLFKPSSSSSSSK